MNGIEILNSYQIIETSWGFSWIGIIFAIITIISCILFCYYANKKMLWTSIMNMILVIIFSTCTFGFFNEGKKIEITRYEITISDEVNYNEFIKKYDVIEERGKIFVVEEK